MSVELAKSATEYAAAFRELLANSKDTEPSWLIKRREEAFEHFERAGFPTVREEEWKYTNVAPIARARFQPVLGFKNVTRSLNGNAKNLLFPEAKESRLVFVNGVFQRELSSSNLPDGVGVSDLSIVLG